MRLALVSSVVSIIAVYLEIRWQISLIGEEAIESRSIILLFLCQAMILCGFFCSVLLIKEHFIKDKRRHRRMALGEKTGLALQICSVFLTAIHFFLLQLSAPLMLLGAILIGLGIYQYIQTKSSLSVSFLLWGIEQYLFLGFFLLLNDTLSVWMVI